MDPNATLRDLNDALADCNYLLANELRECLHSWLHRAGFEPDWKSYPRAAFYCGR